MNEIIYKKIAQDLFYVEYDNFDFDTSVQVTNEKYRPRGPLCSGIRKGGFAGRNFDGYSDLKTVLVMRISNRCARFSSLSVTTSYLDPSLPEIAERQEKDEAYFVMPQLAVDGVNEKGLSIMSFMVQNCEASEDRANWGEREWGKSAAFTNRTAAKTYNTMSLVRFVLDNAADIDEAVELIRSVNWFDPDRFTSSGHAASLKWLLSDPEKSAVVECIDNEMKILVSANTCQSSPCTLTANFSLYLFQKGIIQNRASGYERYDQMADQYGREETSAEGVKHILGAVVMSEKYQREITDKHFFATDYLWDESPSGRHFTSEELYSGNAKKDPDFLKTIELSKSRYFGQALRPQNHRDIITIYTSVYNLEEKSVQILLQEGAASNEWHPFKLHKSN